MSALREALRKAESAAPAAERETIARGVAGLSLEPVEARTPEAAGDAPMDSRVTGVAPPSTDTLSAPRARLPSRAPFYVVLVLLAASGSAAGGYFWVQLRAASAPPRALPTPGATPQRTEAPRLPAAAAAQRIAGLADADDAPASVPPAPPALVASAPQPQPVPRASAAAVAETAPPRQAPPRIHPRLADAQAALRAHRVELARAAFAEVLAEEPLNRDALLGAAAVEMLAGRTARAEAHLERLLGVHPEDIDAHTAHLALREARLDARAAERHVKDLLRDDAQPAALHFLLGNQYARQRRWAEAHDAYLRARERDAEHPDLAFNLAVALEHLGRHGEARDEYARALAYAEQRMALFDRAAAQRRLQALAR